MGRPKAHELTQREFEVMQVIWKLGEATTQAIHDRLESGGDRCAFVTTSNLVRALHSKGFLTQTNSSRPFTYVPRRSFEDVSKGLVADLVSRVFRGSREQLLLRIFSQSKLSRAEREFLEQLLRK